jgi:hypothetical protein
VVLQLGDVKTQLSMRRQEAYRLEADVTDARRRLFELVDSQNAVCACACVCVPVA